MYQHRPSAASRHSDILLFLHVALGPLRLWGSQSLSWIRIEVQIPGWLVNYRDRKALHVMRHSPGQSQEDGRADTSELFQPWRGTVHLPTYLNWRSPGPGEASGSAHAHTDHTQTMRPSLQVSPSSPFRQLMFSLLLHAFFLECKMCEKQKQKPNIQMPFLVAGFHSSWGYFCWL